MQENQYINAISLETFKDILSRYGNVVPEKLSTLDEQRYVEIPKLVAGRSPESYITKSELVQLVDWKLSHGKFRPSLRGLALSNGEEDVRDTTKEAFATENAEAALRILTKLKGIGPATASLLLSVHRPEAVPFFSDELFRWCFFNDKAGEGWDRKIKYTPKEHRELDEQVAKLRERLQSSDKGVVSAVDIEKVAYVLGKESLSGAVMNIMTQKDGKKRIAEEDMRPVPSKAAKKEDKPQQRRSARTKPAVNR